MRPTLTQDDLGKRVSDGASVVRSKTPDQGRMEISGLAGLENRLAQIFDQQSKLLTRQAADFTQIAGQIAKSIQSNQPADSSGLEKQLGTLIASNEAALNSYRLGLPAFINALNETLAKRESSGNEKIVALVKELAASSPDTAWDFKVTERNSRGFIKNIRATPVAG